MPVTKQQWTKHAEFDSGISRLQYVQLCMIEYIQKAQESKKVKKLERKKNAAVVTNITTTKEIFYTTEDLFGIKKFTCASCNCITSAKKVKWISYDHFNNTKSPICWECFNEAYACDTSTTSSVFAM